MRPGDPPAARRGVTLCRRTDCGMASAGVILAVGLLTYALVGLVNLAVYHYGHGALRTVADQAARAGSRASATTDICEQRASETVDALFRGPLGDQITVDCRDDGEQVHVTVTGTFDGWVPAVPDQAFTVTATVTKEREPPPAPTRPSRPGATAGGARGGLAPAMVTSLERAGMLLGEPVPITSGYRSPGDQQALWEQRHTNPYPVAPPGSSMHERGLAIDVPADYVSRLLAVADQVGLCQTLPASDPVHFEVCG